MVLSCSIWLAVQVQPLATRILAPTTRTDVPLGRANSLSWISCFACTTLTFHSLPHPLTSNSLTQPGKILRINCSSWPSRRYIAGSLQVVGRRSMHSVIRKTNFQVLLVHLQDASSTAMCWPFLDLLHRMHASPTGSTKSTRQRSATWPNANSVLLFSRHADRVDLTLLAKKWSQRRCYTRVIWSIREHTFAISYRTWTYKVFVWQVINSLWRANTNDMITTMHGRDHPVNTHSDCYLIRRHMH